MKNTIKRILLAVLIVLASSCSSGSPSEQVDFYKSWGALRSEYKDASGNEIAKKAIAEKGDAFFNASKNRKVKEWVVKVTRVLSENYIIAEGLENVTVEYKLRLRRPAKVSELHKGDKVLFSGALQGESSFTTVGRYMKAEIDVDVDELKANGVNLLK